MNTRLIKQFLPILFFSAITAAFAQEGFKLGAQAGLPIGDLNDQIGVVVGADVGYMWAPGKIMDLGIKAGFLYGFAEKFRPVEGVTVDLPSLQFAPIAASVRFWPGKSFSFGGDVGQAFGLNDGNEGGFYYRPQIGFQVGPQSELNFSYTSISGDNGDWTTITLGYVYTFLSARHFR